MSTALDIARLGVDVDIPVDPDGAITPTPTGDIPLLSGRSALDRGLLRRIVTEPGAMIYRPGFGVGALTWLGAANSPVERARLGAAVRRNLLADPRIVDASVTVAPQTDATDSPVVTVAIQLRDDTRSTLVVPL